MQYDYPQLTEFKHLSFGDCNKYFFESILLEGLENDLLGIERFPRIVDVAGLCICLEGEAGVVIGSRSYRLKPGDMCVVFPHDILYVTEKSLDFKGYTIACTSDFLMSVNIPSSTPIYLFRKEHPCISLDDKEKEELMKMCEFLREHDQRKDHPCREEISRYLASAIIYEVIGIYKRGEPLPQQQYSRKDKIYFEFTELIAKNCNKQHNMDFYARKLFISPRYLSAICKEIAGITATEYINHHIMVNARLLLATTDKSILQISEEMNFPNASFFTQFFKKHEGVTPKVYRGMNSIG